MTHRAVRTLFLICLGGVAVLTAAYVFRGQIRYALIELKKPPVPSAQPRPSVTPSPSTPGSTSSPLPTVAPIPNEVNLAVPFVLQAPYHVWDYDHDEFCEEAAVLMAASYLSGDTSVARADVAEARLQAIKQWEMDTFGYFEDTNAAETARILREFLGVTPVRMEANPTIEQIKAYLAAGKIILIPAAGQMLANPYYTQPGPVYHMIVIKGYTEGGMFITNDPGTRHGADFLYPFETVMSAIHDYNGGDVLRGAKVIIIVG